MFGDVPLAEITRQEIQAYVAHLNQDGDMELPSGGVYPDGVRT